MYHLRRAITFTICVAALSFLTWFLPRILNPVAPTPKQRRLDEAWVGSSPYWLDRQTCRWLSLCGAHHVRWDPPTLRSLNPDDGDLRLELRSSRESGKRRIQRRSWESAGRTQMRARSTQGNSTGLKDIPGYVLAHAPLVHLYSGENFWPADIAEHLKHMTSYKNGLALNLTQPISLRNLHKLNAQRAPVYLASNDDVEDRPEWLHSHHGIPLPFADGGEDDAERQPEFDGSSPISEPTTWFDADRDHLLHRISDPRKPKGRWHGSGLLPRAVRSKASQRHVTASQHPIDGDFNVPIKPQHKLDQDGYSEAPAVLVVVDKGSGILDAFWFL